MKKILLTGATGYVGGFFGPELVKKDYDIVALSRDKKRAKKNLDFPCTVIEPDELSHLKDVDYVVHLAGASIAGQRWTPSYKRTLYKSRVDFTKEILESLDTSSLKAWVQMSATGYYKPQDEPEITEADGEKNPDFIGDLVKDWEEASASLDQRKVYLRMGMVLGPQSQVVEKMKPLFKARLGAVLGSGEQYMPWIHVEDTVSVLLEALEDSQMQGVYNLTAPELINNKSFTYAMAKALNTSVILPPAPKFSLRILYGEMADILLDSLPVVPERLKKKGYTFKYPKLDKALEASLPKLEAGERELVRHQWIPEDLEATFEFFKNEENLERITPNDLNFKVLSKSTESIEEGTLIYYKLGLFHLPFYWTTKITHWNPPHEFADFQLKGPYAKWDHRHTFERLGEGTLMKDRVVYKVPFGLVGRIFGQAFVNYQVKKIFDFRKRKIRELYSS